MIVRKRYYRLGKYAVTPAQRKRANALIRKTCCNYENGNCLLLDDGEEYVCPQTISYSVCCKWFRWAVLPQDKALEAEIFHSDSVKRCTECGAAFVPRSNRENIVSAVVHMDEKTPHLHLTFVPLTKDNRLCAKEILGNRASLTKWQDDFYAYMVEKYPDLERGESASKTGRRHIPTRLFKQAISLSKQAKAIEAALDGISPLNAGKKKEEALAMLKKWFPQMENFFGQLKKYKVTIADLLEAIIVKDHSRLGRNRLVIGQLLEEILEEHNVRYIAVTDNIDSLNGLDDMVAVRDLFNEWYARDTSKKIRAVVLEKLVLKHLQGTVQYVREYESEFVRSMGEKSAADRRKEISAKRRGLSQAQRRMEELDRLFQRLYEDNVSGKISDERFTKLSGGYEAEQKELQEKVAILQAELTGQEEQAMNLDRFLAIVKKYTEIEKLTPTILNEFVEKIIVHAPDKNTGKRVQQVEISYNCVGVIELPDTNETDSKMA